MRSKKVTGSSLMAVLKGKGVFVSELFWCVIRTILVRELREIGA
jgi:hypothetical protein